MSLYLKVPLLILLTRLRLLRSDSAGVFGLLKLKFMPEEEVKGEASN
jgi:hypothetical protein